MKRLMYSTAECLSCLSRQHTPNFPALLPENSDSIFVINHSLSKYLLKTPNQHFSVAWHLLRSHYSVHLIKDVFINSRTHLSYRTICKTRTIKFSIKRQRDLKHSSGVRKNTFSFLFTTETFRTRGANNASSSSQSRTIILLTLKSTPAVPLLHDESDSGDFAARRAKTSQGWATHSPD